MAKKRKKKSRTSTQNQPTVVHRYSAEEEAKKDQRKKFKIRGIVTAAVAAILALLSLLIF